MKLSLVLLDVRGSQICLIRHASKQVIITELLKIMISTIFLWFRKELHLLREINLKDSFFSAGIPAISYSLQNICIFAAMFALDPLVFNLLNPTKVAFTVIFSYLVLGRRSSFREGIALILLFFVVFILRCEENSRDPVCVDLKIILDSPTAIVKVIYPGPSYSNPSGWNTNIVSWV